MDGPAAQPVGRAFTPEFLKPPPFSYA